MVKLCVYTFSNLFDGLPAGGPFDLKLLAWLNRADIPYELRFQVDTRKAPKGKNPWIELDGERIGDTELIIARLSALLQVNVEAGLSAEEAAVAHAWRRTFEEHFHQIFEWELLVHPAGAQFMRKSLAKQMPPCRNIRNSPPVCGGLRGRNREPRHSVSLKTCTISGCTPLPWICPLLASNP